MTTLPASVAIVGAGPGGLTAAKALLSLPNHAFRVTIFERQSRVGGMWALSRTSSLSEGKVSKEMMTNLSRFTDAFSDLAWENVELDSDQTNGKRTGQKVEPPMFPRAWQVGRYLQEYARRYVPEEVVKLNCEVVNADRVDEAGSMKWRVRWQHPHTDPITEDSVTVDESCGLFDYLIISSGFFDKPRPLLLKDHFPASGYDASVGDVKIIHSTAFRSLESILPNGVPSSGKIVVIGGGMSGAEAAANAAFFLSDAAYSSPTTSSKAELRESLGSRNGIQIHHVASRPFYNMPRYLSVPRPSSEKASEQAFPSFLPVDLVFYDLSRRPGNTISANTGRVPPETTKSTHRFLRSFVGDQSDLSQALVATEEELGKASYVAISDTYAEFVRSGLIVPLRGTVTRLEEQNIEDTRTSLSASIVDANGTKPLNDVVAVIHATGFRCHSALTWLDPAVLADLEYSKDSERLPLFLQDHAVYNDVVPNLGFVGFYEGPFWGVMEMQARLLADRFLALQQEKAPKPGMLDRAEEHAKFEELRASIHKQDRNVPQFWQGDYVGIVEDYAQFMGIEREDEGFGLNGDPSPSVPARFTTKTPTTASDTQVTLQSLHNILDRDLGSPGSSSRFLSCALFRALQGDWLIHRTVTSALPTFPSGLLEGTATFYPRSPSSAGYAAEYFYEEKGTLLMTNGYEVQASRQYAYRLSDGVGHRTDVAYGELGPEAERGSRDGITAWFVKEDRSVDYLFHRVRLDGAQKDSQAFCNATGSHLCVKDTYETEYKFEFDGVNVKRFNIKYHVSGPSKDYTHDTWFQRAQKEGA
ncbi:FAD/NAD(P)-binding domain-containing protein [Eremomyces bilateralis CBS 781.70]|uniref:FAD/NAD(P)-binding domain-containing protein n=1 Tax=Eremomyces bilateralis CBS 781.70 TaxID=1392243 RepID=A0A6G1GBE7_9PEZI|nr:FAD/NAD(P)-binding domain-containing protein [Eremomyces bilateralis CBS 781.70]KAF1815373.1 FAD/NAD(P)-binding domain-containing protein [Eremomyces bilateralis CBS 781.70]